MFLGWLAGLSTVVNCHGPANHSFNLVDVVYQTMTYYIITLLVVLIAVSKPIKRHSGKRKYVVVACLAAPTIK